MPYKDEEKMLATTTTQLTRTSMTALEKTLHGEYTDDGYKLTKRSVFQYLIDLFNEDEDLRQKALRHIKTSKNSRSDD